VKVRDGTLALGDPSKIMLTARVLQRSRLAVLAVVDQFQHRHLHLRQPLHLLAQTGQTGVTPKAAHAALILSADIAHRMAVKDLDGIILHGAQSLIMQTIMVRHTMLAVLVVVAVLRLLFEVKT